MITCPNCLHQNPDRTPQCEACYTPLPTKISCPSCGSNVLGDASFCDRCGFALIPELPTIPLDYTNQQMNGTNLTYLTSRDFMNKGSGIVSFGAAPDGLPFLTSINAPPRAEDLLKQAAQALGAESSNPLLENSPLEPLVKELDRLLKEHHVQHLTKSDGTLLEVMVLPKSISTLCGPTLLAHLFKAGRKTVPSSNLGIDTRNVPNPPTTYPSPGVITGVSASSSSIENVPLPPATFRSGHPYLGLPLNGQQPVVVRKESGTTGWLQYSLLRDFIAESTSIVQDGQLEIEFHNGVTWSKESVYTTDVNRYRSLKLKVQSDNWKWIVPRNSVAQIILDIVRCLERLHGDREIHGDIKPENVLLTAKGVHLFDSLGLSEGMRSPAMTRGWAAPEQVMGKPVSYATDFYPIGIMLSWLLEGVPYGELTKVVIPIGGTRLETHTVLKNPGIYIDPDTAPVEREAIPAWSKLISQCICFDPADRFPSATALIEALQPLVAGRSLKNCFSVPLSFGSAVVANNGVESPTPCWLA
jgi:Protein kinase domain/Double zinc ribbon